MTRDEIAARNRLLAPIAGEFIAAMRAEFGKEAQLWLSENGNEAGKREDYGGMMSVHSGEMASVDDYVAREAKRA